MYILVEGHDELGFVPGYLGGNPVRFPNHGLLHPLCGDGGLPSDCSPLVFPRTKHPLHRSLPCLPTAEDVVNSPWRYDTGACCFLGHLPGPLVHRPGDYTRDGTGCFTDGSYRMDGCGCWCGAPTAWHGGAGGHFGGSEERSYLCGCHAGGPGPP